MAIAGRSWESETTPTGLARVRAESVLEREFLELRAKLLELAASFDRLDRADGSVHQDVRWQQIRQSLEILADGESGRAERLQLLFSLAYDPAWRETFQIHTERA